MKKAILSVFVASLLFAVFPAQAKASATPIPVTAVTPVVNESAEAQAMLARLNEIKAMDMKSLSAADKKQLRHEVKAMKNHSRESGGVYLSVGAIIIICLLLILLL